MGCAWGVYDALVSEGSDSAIPCPMLKNLEVKFMVMSRRGCGDKRRILGLITIIVEFKAKRGHPLRYFWLDFSSNLEGQDPVEWITRCRASVRTVKWAGMGESESDASSETETEIGSEAGV